MRWTELAARVARDIEGGRWAAGERLPGVRLLAREAGCSPGTAARSYAALRDAGVLAGSPRSRFVVAPHGPDTAADWRADPVALRLAGSDDPALDTLVRAAGGSVQVAPGPRGSIHGVGAARSRYGRRRGAPSPRHGHRLVERPARATLAAIPSGSCTCGDGIRGSWSRTATRSTSAGRRPRRAPGRLEAARTGSRLLLESLMRREGCEPPDLGVPATRTWRSRRPWPRARRRGPGGSAAAARRPGSSGSRWRRNVRARSVRTAAADAALLDLLASAAMQARWRPCRAMTSRPAAAIGSRVDGGGCARSSACSACSPRSPPWPAATTMTAATAASRGSRER